MISNFTKNTGILIIYGWLNYWPNINKYIYIYIYVCRTSFLKCDGQVWAFVLTGGPCERMDPTFFGRVDVGILDSLMSPLGLPGLISQFILFSCLLHPIWPVAVVQTINWGDGQNSQKRWSVFMEVTDGHERMVAKNWDSSQNDRLVEDGVREMTVRDQWMLVMRTFRKGMTDIDTVITVGVWQTAEAFKTKTRVTRRLVRILDRSAASSSVHSTYKNQRFSFIFSLCVETSLSERIRRLSEPNPFTSFSNKIYSFTSFFGKWSYPFILLLCL